MSSPIQPPKGTRDFYPEAMLVRRYITDAWRRTALRHGFDEIDGPTFESRELYEKKSGEGILNEMFSVFSGKDLGQREALQQGEPAPFGLRPEFTPTLARMYAAKARQLPQPCKWFCVSNFFRAERPQRGRLREFFQWNCDVIGGEADTLPALDLEAIQCATSLFASLGLVANQVQACINSRSLVQQLLQQTLANPTEEYIEAGYALLDKRNKINAQAFADAASQIGFDHAAFDQRIEAIAKWLTATSSDDEAPAGPLLGKLFDLCAASGDANWLKFDPFIVRGLAYYTGTVFEVIAEGERAVAGGGRYDNLIELFGGPPTPACGFGMGDVVLENLLNDHNLMPTGRDLVRALSAPMPVRPDAFLVTNGDDGAAQQLIPILAALRRGVFAEGEREPWDPQRYAVAPIHARRSYKSTSKIGKLKADANAQHARLFVILESDTRCTIEDLDGAAEAQRDVPIAELPSVIAGILASGG